MASVLSGWYGYNIFNVANFIEYEPYPKRRKVDKSNNYRQVAVAEPQDYELKHEKRTGKAAHVVTFRPYSEVQQQHQQQQRPTVKKRYSKSEAAREKCRTRHERSPEEGTTVDNLFPEILCLIFEKLDVQSKGRAAQVTLCSFLLELVCYLFPDRPSRVPRPK